MFAAPIVFQSGGFAQPVVIQQSKPDASASSPVVTQEGQNKTPQKVVLDLDNSDGEVLLPDFDEGDGGRCGSGS